MHACVRTYLYICMYSMCMYVHIHIYVHTVICTTYVAIDISHINIMNIYYVVSEQQQQMLPLAATVHKQCT